MIVYIAGKMTGLPDCGRAKFAAAEAALRACGHKVLNPAVLPDDLPKPCYMPICMAMLQQAEALVLLEDWYDSPGATMERDFATYQGIPVVYLCGGKLTEGMNDVLPFDEEGG